MEYMVSFQVAGKSGNKCFPNVPEAWAYVRECQRSWTSWNIYMIMDCGRGRWEGIGEVFLPNL